MPWVATNSHEDKTPRQPTKASSASEASMKDVFRDLLSQKGQPVPKDTLEELKRQDKRYRMVH